MNIDHTSMTAESSANVRGRAVSGVSVHTAAMLRGARRAGVICMLACATLVAFAPAQAQDRGGFRKDDLQQQRHDDRGDRGERNVQRQDAPRYDARADDARHQQQDRGDAQRRSGRLTPDERRDLRRQINEANIDLYPNTPPRR